MVFGGSLYVPPPHYPHLLFVCVCVCVCTLSSKQQQGSCYHTKEPSWGNRSKAASDIIIARHWHRSSLWVRGEIEMKKNFALWRKVWSRLWQRATEKAETVGKDGNRWRADKRVIWELASVCCAVLDRAVHGEALTVEPERSLTWHVWCGPAPAIQPFVVPPYWAAWQWSAKQQWQRGPTIRMANLLMHPRADSLTFLFTTQSGCERDSDEKTERGRGKKQTKCCFSFNRLVVSCSHSCCGIQHATLRASWFCLRQQSSGGHR